MSERRVVITGLGTVCPLGNDVTSAWENATCGRSGIGPITLFDASEHSSKIAAEVKNFDPEKYVEKKDLRRYDRFSLFALAAVEEAWQRAGLNEEPYSPERMGCILGVGIGGLPVLEQNHTALVQDGPRKISPFLIPAMIGNLAPGNVAIAKNLQGINYAMTSACASGTHGIA